MASSMPERYDRQVRLWGDHGQSSLSQANVAILGSSALATEVLKSLILAGIGGFEIFDNNRVQESDLGNNFFVQRKNLEEFRGEIIKNSLCEMNTLVKGSFVCYDFTKDSLKVLNNFTLVIATNFPRDLAVQISDYLFEQNIPFLWASCSGLIGYARVVYKEHEVLHDHREMPPHDFRLQHPFSALLKFADTFDLNSMGQEQHSHVPYLILYLKALEKWRKVIEKPNALPDNYANRKNFLKILMEMQVLNEKGIYNEVNFLEAKQQLVPSFTGFQVNENLQKLFNDSRVDLPNGSEEPVSSFWTYISALKSFYLSHGYLPLSGQLPDMTSDTSTYINLVNLYQKQAESEAEEVFDLAIRLRNSPKCRKTNITLEETKKFCKNAPRLNAFTGTQLSQEIQRGLKPILKILLEEYKVRTGMPKEISETDEFNPSVNPLVWLVLVRAVENFYSIKNRYPGKGDVSFLMDSEILSEQIESMFKDLEDTELSSVWKELIPEHAIDEICRYGSSEFNVIASILGGVVAQEAIKICTRQYLPFDNTFIYDGNTQSSVTVKL